MVAVFDYFVFGGALLIRPEKTTTSFSGKHGVMCAKFRLLEFQREGRSREDAMLLRLHLEASCETKLLVLARGNLSEHL